MQIQTRVGVKRERGCPFVSSDTSISIDAVTHSREEGTIVHKRLRGQENGATSGGTAAVLGAPHQRVREPSAQRLQFYGFFSTTAFDRSIITPGECAVLAAEMAVDFFAEASVLYDMTTDIKVVNEEASAMDELMRRLARIVNDDGDKAAVNDPVKAPIEIRNIYSGLVRVYAYLFQRYYSQFVVLDVEAHLTACWHRLLAFAAEYKVLEEEFINTIFDYIQSITSQHR